jgi:endonuclease/exonuclease/phosphatase family metal-dependent hydrolase
MVNLKILTWNLWHGLNPYSQVLMLPVESPLQYWVRREKQVERLRNWRPSSTDILCLQEVNPLPSRLSQIQNALGLLGDSTTVNAGIKVGKWGIPPFLNEGLAILRGSGFAQCAYSERTLSGGAIEKQGPLGVNFHIQLSERRKCLLFEGNIGGHRIAVANLHLHHGPDGIVANLQRKTQELEELRKWIESRLESWDLLFVCGDFNCEETSPCLRPLQSLGLALPSAWDASQNYAVTWDPQRNKLISHSSHHANSDAEREWDGAPHSFDRIYLKSKIPIRQIQIEYLREPELSDHYGVSLEVEL